MPNISIPTNVTQLGKAITECRRQFEALSQSLQKLVSVQERLSEALDRAFETLGTLEDVSTLWAARKAEEERCVQCEEGVERTWFPRSQEWMHFQARTSTYTACARQSDPPPAEVTVES